MTSGKNSANGGRAHWSDLRLIGARAGGLAVANYIALGLNMVGTVVAARALGQDAFGWAAMVLAYPALILSVATVKSVTITTRYVARFRAAGDEDGVVASCQLGWLIDITVGCFAFLVVCATAAYVATTFPDPRVSTFLLCMYAAVLPLSAMSSTATALLMGLECYRDIAVLRLLRSAVHVVLVLLATQAGWGVPGYVAAVGTSLVIGSLLDTTAAVRRTRKQFPDVHALTWLRSRLSKLKQIESELRNLFGWNFLLTSLTGIVDNLPVLLLGHFSGHSSAGYYKLATSVATAGMQLENSLAKSVYPGLVATWTSNSVAEMKARLRRWTLSMGLASAVAVLAVTSLLGVLVPLVFGDGYGPAVGGIQILLVAVAVKAALFWLHPIYYAAARVNLYTKQHLPQAGLVVLAGWWVAGTYGFIGVATLVAVGRLTQTIFAVIGVDVVVRDVGLPTRELHRSAREFNRASKLSAPTA
jgi:O-antigen/teichoic acid export membrane protein